jgi:signal recognition particle receptor subunit beta
MVYPSSYQAFQLTYGQVLHTHTSLQTNSSISVLSEKKTIRVIDVPGHPRIRDQFQEHLSDAKAIAFVVDTNTISRNGAMVAESVFAPPTSPTHYINPFSSRHLHHILHAVTSLPPSHSPPSLLILAHKADLLKAASSASSDVLAVNRVKNILERELEKRRVSHSGGVGVEGLGEEGEQYEMGGLDRSSGRKGEFKFDDWEGGDISFIGTSLRVGMLVEDQEKSEQEGLSLLLEWLDEHM